MDLIGLPPSRHQLHEFLTDQSPHAYDRVVDRLLESPQYGERWGRHWMDIWRYSDWYGLGKEVRFSHPHIWRWRDWIVQSLNSDLGYDQMLVAMLAGDELAPEHSDTVRATGFLARNWDIFNRTKSLDSTIEHMSRSFMGLTMQCARCHDHKYDPVSQMDYYRLRAVFEPSRIRVDRIPGQPDRTVNGISRVFDDMLAAPTYLFVRGDETQPDTSRSIAPGVPNVLGGTLDIVPIELPAAVYNPDKRNFVIAESLDAADATCSAAAESLDKARVELQRVSETVMPKDGTTEPSPESLRQKVVHAELAFDAAQKKRTALHAVVAVEKLDEDGGPETHGAEWNKAARAAVAAQRLEAQASSKLNRMLAEQAVAQARAKLDELLVAANTATAVATQGPSDQAKLDKATADLAKAESHLTEVLQQQCRGEEEELKPLSTDYVPRQLEFPRAKIFYEEVLTNAPYSSVSSGRRLALARWIANRRNPLTARVAVNHIWARHFGQPLVANLFDFGLRSPRPLHHDLLDWLAIEFMDTGWSMKHLHRLMATSATYQMSSASPQNPTENFILDPDNQYYWRMNPRRMEAEVIRDSLLSLAGRLDPTIGGPDIPAASADEGVRRSIYYKYARDQRVLFLTMFDAPSVEECYFRHETIVPQQALALSHAELSLAHADAIASILTAEIGQISDTTFVDTAFEHVLGRFPVDSERDAATQSMQRLTEIEQTEASSDLPLQIRVRSAFIHVLINHNDFVMIR